MAIQTQGSALQIAALVPPLHRTRNQGPERDVEPPKATVMVWGVGGAEPGPEPGAPGSQSCVEIDRQMPNPREHSGRPDRTQEL